MSITVVYNMSEDRVQIHILYGQPFGAGHAAPNFDRVAALVNDLAVCYLFIMQGHFSQPMLKRGLALLRVVRSHRR